MNLEAGMLRALLAMCLFAVFLCVGQLLLVGVVLVLACIGAGDVALFVWGMGFILLLPAAFFLAGHVVLWRFGPIPTCKPQPSTDWADSE
jgi:hypothetical protein